MTKNSKKSLSTAKPNIYKIKPEDTISDKIVKKTLQFLDWVGVDEKIKKADNDLLYRKNLYNAVDPGASYPQNLKDVIHYGLIAKEARKGKPMKKVRETNDPVADAAWAKRLGVSYNSVFLPSNGDGTVRLPKSLEEEIPVDTNFFKKRIAENKKLSDYYTKAYGYIPFNKREAIELGLKYDEQTLDALRKTFKTGEPVTINEHGYINRNWIKNGESNLTPSPLSLFQNFTIQYDKEHNRMNYKDYYNFNQFEHFVPGKPFTIKGTVPVKLQHKKK